MTRLPRTFACVLALSTLAGACGTANRPELVAIAQAEPQFVAAPSVATPADAPTPTPIPAPTATATAAPTATATPAPTSTPPPTPPPTPTPTPTAAPEPTAAPTAPPEPTSTPLPAGLQVHEQAYWAMAGSGDLTLYFPADTVQYVGFHESAHDGAQQLELLDFSVQAITLGTRGRGTGSRTAADIVVDPLAQIRSPVTGTVLRSGTYTLYCEHSDDFVYIEPDARPGWEVKIFHISGVQVTPGARVQAGVTVLAPRATQLPFESQIDEYTAEPSWPHVHIEVVDPSIPDETNAGSC